MPKDSATRLQRQTATATASPISFVPGLATKIGSQVFRPDDDLVR